MTVKAEVMNPSSWCPEAHPVATSVAVVAIWYTASTIQIRTLHSDDYCTVPAAGRLEPLRPSVPATPIRRTEKKGNISHHLENKVAPSFPVFPGPAVRNR